MTKLPLQFKRDGFDYNQEFRQNQVAIYRQTKAKQPKNIHFEVGIIRENATYEFHGTTIEAHESWPSSESWGVKAWTYQSLDEAMKRAKTLL